MGKYSQANRPLSIKTPLGPDVVLLVGFRGSDALSELFRYRTHVIAENETTVAFDKILGQPCTVTLKWGKDNAKTRHFNGICTRISQGERDPVFTQYDIELMPKVWLLTRKAQSRTFQHMAVPDILKKVLTGFTIKFDLRGTYQPRDYCVQYRETDFNFACRLMEEEGIFYFFKHDDGDHTMVVGDTPSSFEAVPVQSSVPYEEKFGGPRPELRIDVWEKAQYLRSGKYTLWDNSFELPDKHLEAEKVIQDSVSAGSVSHKLKVAGNDKLEIYDFPGEYAQRFDGVDKGGGEQPQELEKIFQDNLRTVGIRMQQEAVESLEIEGRGNCRQFVSGHKFTLEHHFNADGEYLLTGVTHLMAAASTDYRSGLGEPPPYQGTFTCIPLALPYRPPRVTPKPIVQGTQSAVVVGPSGEEIFTDKYGRVKVQFRWDRQGKLDPDSSCWIRVATMWAGKHWGMIHIPRIGQEVIVDFLEGDPDQPVIVGSVYNADMMPPYGLPANKTQSGVQSRSSLGGTPANFNEIKFEDKKGHELLTIHAERNQSISVEADESHTVGHDRSKTIGHDETTKVANNRTETVGVNESITIGSNRTEQVGSNETITIGANRTEAVALNEAIAIGAAQEIAVGAVQTITVGGLRSVTVGGAQIYAFGGNVTMTVGGNCSVQIEGKHAEKVVGERATQVGSNRSTEVGGNDTLKISQKLSVEAGDEIVLKTGSASIVLKQSGDIEIKGTKVKVKASAKVETEAAMVSSEASGVHTIKGNLVKIN